MTHTPGYGGYQGTGLSEEILASTVGLKKVSITIDASARDVNNTVDTTYLRRGLIMWPDTAHDDKFTEFDGAAATAVASKDAVVLGEDVQLDGTNDAVAMAYFAACFKKDKIFDNSGTGLSNWVPGECQRLEIRANL